MNSPLPRYGLIDRDYGMRLATTPPENDGPVWMVNLMKYRDVADYADGRESTVSGKEADDLYTPLESLAAVGAEPVFFGDVDQQLLGDGTVWDRIGVVKYPTRSAFIAMQSRPEFQRSHEHKDAGMDKTIVMGCQPMAASVSGRGPAAPSAKPTRSGTIGPEASGPSPIRAASGTEPPPEFVAVDWADVPHPPTDDDGPVVVLHVIRFADAEAADRTPAHMEAYQSQAAVAASRHGAKISGWFSVEGTIIGDGRQWHQARFNLFPSKAAFMAVVADPARLAAQKEHRESAIADTYTMIVRPTMNRLAESIGAA